MIKQDLQQIFNRESSDVLHEIALQTDDIDIFYQILKNANVSDKTIIYIASLFPSRQLGFDLHHELNKTDALKTLSHNLYFELKQGIAENQNTPVDILKKIAFDKEEVVWSNIPHIRKLTRKI